MLVAGNVINLDPTDPLQKRQYNKRGPILLDSSPPTITGTKTNTSSNCSESLKLSPIRPAQSCYLLRVSQSTGFRTN